jgi:hypothetical protein
MNNYDKLKSIIQEANPEIMELKFECELLWRYNKGDNRNVVKKIIGYDRDRAEFETADGSGYRKSEIEKGRTKHYATGKDDAYLTNLGRPIRLADVLLGIRLNCPDDYFVGLMGNYYKWVDGDLILISAPMWNLRDDNLDHQSDETKQFLINLLTNE